MTDGEFENFWALLYARRPPLAPEEQPDTTNESTGSPRKKLCVGKRAGPPEYRWFKRRRSRGGENHAGTLYEEHTISVSLH